MPEIQEILSNVGSVMSDGHVDHIQGTERKKLRMKKEKKEEGEEEEASIEYPDRPGEADCIYYLRTGRCGYASNCRFNHPPRTSNPPPPGDDSKIELPQRDGQPDCGHFLKTGNCKYGSTCKYHHPLDRRGAQEVSLNALGLPIREEKDCPYYLRTQKCKYGVACRFNHPQPTSVDPALPVSGTMLSSLPSTGIPYVAGGALPAWSWTRSSGVPGPHAYMPYFMPPLQGAVATQNWNNYMANMSSVAASDVTGTNLVYNSMNPGELVTGCQADLSAMTISNMPERPDQPDCRYFMSTGGCRYGSDCKFNHPKGRIPHSLGPHGLPLRPGEDICGHFRSYGICKYGPTCKYNHPITGYISSYYFGMPSASIPYLNQPVFPSPRNSTDTSNSKSSKITDWIQKPETVGAKNRQHSATKPTHISQEKADNQSISVTVETAEIPHDQSD